MATRVPFLPAPLLATRRFPGAVAASQRGAYAPTPPVFATCFRSTLKYDGWNTTASKGEHHHGIRGTDTAEGKAGRVSLNLFQFANSQLIYAAPTVRYNVDWHYASLRDNISLQFSAPAITLFTNEGCPSWARLKSL